MTDGFGTLPLQTPAVVHPHLQSARTTFTGTMLGLGIAQIVVAIFTFALGIAANTSIGKQWSNSIAFGIWAGLLILTAGILCTGFSRLPNNMTLHCAHLIFSILTTLVSFVCVVFSVVGLTQYSDCHRRNTWMDWGSVPSSERNYNGYDDDHMCAHQTAGKIIYSYLLFLMVAEFFLSLASSCQDHSCCNNQPCCNNQREYRIQQLPTTTNSVQNAHLTNAGYLQDLVPRDAVAYISPRCPQIVISYGSQMTTTSVSQSEPSHNVHNSEVPTWTGQCTLSNHYEVQTVDLPPED